MAVYLWENFQDEKYFGRLCNFFNNDILGKSRWNNGEEWDSVVFISRKAYCLFLLLKSKGIIKENHCKIYSDRYVMKSLDPGLFKGEKIALVDDTVSTGRHMADIYRMIEQRTSVSGIIPIVFAADEGLSVDNGSETIRTEYNFNIHYVVRWSASDILKFCSVETLIMHQEEIPYVVELPTLSEQNAHHISMSEEQFQKLKLSKKQWKYLESNEAGYEQNNIMYGMMVMRDGSIAECLSPFVFRFCVRMQITKKNKEYRMIANPFAILRSVKFEELYQLFSSIYKGTSYYEAVQKYIRDFDKNEEDIYVAIYRGVVYNLSEYIGWAFRTYLTKEILSDKSLVMQEYNKVYNFEESFCESTSEIFRENFVQYLLEIINFPKITPIIQKNSLSQYINKFRGIQCDYRTVSLYLLALINEIRYTREEKDVVDIECEQRMKFITIEELQMTLYETFSYEEKEYLDDILVKCIGSMLGQSKLANEIFYEKKSKIVYRGFKYGENSEALLDLSAKIFYVGVQKYYDIASFYEQINGRNGLYALNYDAFLNAFMMFLYEYNLFGNVITKDEFRIYSEMFRERNPEHLKKKILNKKFLGENTEMPVYLENLKKYIRESDIYY